MNEVNEKVVLTQEQADEIEGLMKEPHNLTRDELLVEHTELGGFTNLNEAEVDLTLLAKALYVGYEVKPKFKVGDWVVLRFEGEEWITDLTKESEFGGFYTDSRLPGEKQKFYSSSILRHATPEEIAEEKERRWWKGNGRKPWELKQGDVVVDVKGHAYNVEEVLNDGVVSTKGVETSLWEIKRRFKVACFAEDRKDV